MHKKRRLSRGRNVLSGGASLWRRGFGLASSVLWIFAADATAQPGAPDPAFNPGVFRGWSPTTVSAMAVQPDGKILVGGNFTNLAGLPRAGLARLNADGTLDQAFHPTNDLATINAIAVYPDGRILVGGRSSRPPAGVLSGQVMRFSATGSNDLQFASAVGGGFEVEVLALSLQPDDRCLVTTAFGPLNASAGMRIAVRLLTNGVRDGSFLCPPRNASSKAVKALQLQPDGKMLLGGDFSLTTSPPHPWLVRLATNGVVDPTFLGTGTGANSNVTALALQPDGRILIAGQFTSYGTRPVPGLARLTAAGKLDTTFEPGTGAQGRILTLALQADGRLLVGGDFTSVDGVPRLGLARLLADGQLDTTFKAASHGAGIVRTLLARPDATTLVGGTLGTELGDGSPPLARLLGGDAAPQAPSVSVMPLDLRVGEGQSALLSASIATTAPYGQQWWFNGLELSGATNLTLRLTNLSLPQAGGYSIVVTNGFGSTTGSATLRVVPAPLLAGRLDTNFHAGSVPGVDDGIMALARQPDGRLLLGGGFPSFDGHARTNLARVEATGQFDPEFDVRTLASGTYPDWVKAVLVQPDGKVVAGGAFTRSFRLGRFTPSGARDTNFYAAGLNGAVNALALQADGKILAGGAFTTTWSGNANRLVRLLTNGLVDGVFRLGIRSGASGPVNSLLVQPDGKILVGGAFATFSNLGHTNLVRLYPDGAVDPTFEIAWDIPGAITAMALEPDGRILIGGGFAKIGGTSRNSLARLWPDGTLDRTFDVGAGVSTAIPVSVSAILVQDDGKVLIGGGFSRYNGQSRNALARLNPDGGLDATFDIGTGADGIVYAMLLEPNGDVVIAGDFTTIDGHPQNRLARLYGDQAGRPLPLLSSLAMEGGRFTASLPTLPGYNYVLEYNDALTAETWQAFAPVPGDSNAIILTDPQATVPQRFYRVRIR